MGYYIDLHTISLDQFKKRLQDAELLPSQQILKEGMDTVFDYFKKDNINNMGELQQILKTKEKVNSFAQKSAIAVPYLTVLRREINSYHPKARKLIDFPCIQKSIKSKLIENGFKTTADIFDSVITPEGRSSLEQELNLTQTELLQIAKLCDLCRLRYVNQTYACLLAASQYDTIEKIKNADPQKMHEELYKINDEQKIYKGKVNLKDIYFLNNDAQYLPIEIVLS